MKLITQKRKIHDIPVLEVVAEENRYEAIPLLVYYHGWQTGKELVLTQARKLAQAGFRVIAPDAMHHGERKTGPVSAVPGVTFLSSIHYNLLEFELLINFFQELHLVTDLYVGGVSMGGITTCALLTQYPEIKAAASIMGSPQPTHYVQMIMTRARSFGGFIPRDYFASLQWVTNVDLSLAPAKIAGRPLLFWHGRQDEKIPFVETASFYESIRQEPYATKVEMIESNEGHLVKGETMEQITDFFKKSLEN